MWLYPERLRQFRQRFHQGVLFSPFDTEDERHGQHSTKAFASAGFRRSAGAYPGGKDRFRRTGPVSAMLP